MRSRLAVLLVGLLAVVGTSCSRDVQKLKRQYLEAGDKSVAQKNYAEAIIQYRNAVAIDPQFGDARFKLANAYAETGDLRNALREYIRAADLMPENVEAQLRAGNGLLAGGQYPEAKARAVAALNKDPKNSRGLILMGNALAGMKDLDGAITQVQEAIDSNPTETLAYEHLAGLEIARGNRSAAEAAFKRAVEIDPKSESAHLALANYYWASRQLAESERELKLAITLAPKSPTANRAIALFYSLSNRPDESEQYLRAYADLSSTAGPKLILADAYILRGKIQEARGVLTPLQATKDGYAPGTLRLAAIDYANGNRPQAYQAIDEVLKREPKNEDAHLEKARFLALDRKLTEALAESNLALKLNASSVAGYYVKGSVLKESGLLDEALSAFQEALRLSPANAATLLKLADVNLARGDAPAAMEFARQVMVKQPTSAPAHFVFAKSLIRQGKLVPAAPEILSLAKQNPNSPDVQLVLGDFFWAKKDLPHAREAYERALNLKDGSFPAIAALVTVDLAQSKPDDAKSKIQAQLAKTPDDERLLLLAGSTFVLTNDLKGAEDAFRHVLRVNPSNIEAYGRLGGVYGSQHRLDEAKSEYEEIAKRNPKMAVTANTMVATILAIQNKPDEARKHYEKALALDPQSPIPANNLAWDYAESGQNLDVALELAQTAKRKLPDAADVSDTLGWVYYKKGLTTLAVTSLEEAARQAPAAPSIQYRLGLAYLKNGEKRKARNSFEQALKMSPEFKEAADAKRALASIKG